MNAQLVADLKAIRELIAVPERWTQHYFALNADGTPTGAKFADAMRG